MKSRKGALLDGQAAPRVRHAPNVRQNSWEDVSDLAASFGMRLDPWQDDVLRAALGERSNGDWAARQVGVSAPRQQGKTTLIVARVLAGLLLFDEKTIVVSAHRQDTSREVFFRLVQLIDDNPGLSDRVDFVARSENREFVRMKSGQEVRFKARSAGAGRGFSCDCLLLDEAQMGLDAAAWSAILPTMSARPNPQVWLFGTPPTDHGLAGAEVFTRFRDAGIAGNESRIAYLEWSADASDDLDDPATWAKANPAYGSRISHEAIAGERATMTDDQFCVERLGMWQAATVMRVISDEAWALVADADSVAVDQFALAVDVAPDLTTASVALAGGRSDGRWHVELVENRRGADWVPGFIGKLINKNPQVRAVVVDVGSPARAIADDLVKLKVKITTPRVADVGAACARLVEAVRLDQVRHIDQMQLGAALASARKRALGQTDMWAWNRKSADADITPIVATTLALWGSQNSKVERPMRRRDGQGRRVAVW